MIQAMFARIARGVRLLLSRLPTDPRVGALRDLLPRPSRGGGAADPLVAVECTSDHYFFALFCALFIELQARKGARGELIVVRSVNGGIGTGWRESLLRSRPLGKWLSNQWVRAFRPWIAQVGYRSLGAMSASDRREDLRRADEAWRSWCADGATFELDIDGIPVGDLIVDSFLRFRPAPRFDPRDRFTLTLMRQAFFDVRLARAYFRRARPALFLVSHSTYIEHGIAVRVALAEGVDVRSFGTLARFGKRLTREDWFHPPNTDNYRSVFESLDDQPARLQLAEKGLGFRLSGGIDSAMTYMRTSAYAASAEVPPEVAGAVVIFMHDFYDSPHIYHDMVFTDFWDWAGFTIETLQAAGIPFFLKPHPNQIDLSSEALLALRARFPDMRLLPLGVTNAQLARAGMSCGVTMYGSVAHELAYLGVPTIACARHPHHSFTFCRTAKTQEEYRRFLQTPRELPASAAEMKRQALAFYYMHNLHGTPEELALRSRSNAFWRVCCDGSATLDQLARAFDAMRQEPGFGDCAARLLAPRADAPSAS